MQKLKNFALYARRELEAVCTDSQSAKNAYIAMILGRYAHIHNMDVCQDQSIIPDYINQRFSADIMSADIFDVENITWLYQYYINADRKSTVDAIGGLETDNCRVAAATQVFTPKWIVEYMVDNSLGRLWYDAYPHTTVTEALTYFIPHSDYANTTHVNPQSIKFFDPCCGCGNILIYAFDVFMHIYREMGYSDADAARSIIENNLYGADIDPYAAGIASFCLMAKAHMYCKDVFATGTASHIEIISNGGIGSLSASDDPRSVTSMKFDVVCTNPPYLARMSKELKEYTKKHFKDYSKDLFTAFMYRGLEYCKDGGYMAYMTPNVWMFLSSHKEIRQYILKNKHICTMAELEKGSYFSSASVDICAFVIQNTADHNEGIYIKPDTQKPSMESQQKAVADAIQSLRYGNTAPCVYQCHQDKFDTIPDNLLLYWADATTLSLFSSTTIGDIFSVKQGMTTGNNKIFLRYWWQVPYKDIGFDLDSTVSAAESGKTWFPYNKGGKYRKWYGNNEYVVMYKDDGAMMKEYTSKLPQGTWVRLKSREYYFKEAVTWSFISSSRFGVRYSPQGSIFDVAGSSLFGENLGYVLGLLGSKVAYYLLQLINPTMNYQIRDIKALPYIFDSFEAERVKALTERCIAISAKEWNSRETSYRFFKNPLIQTSKGIPLQEATEKYITAYNNSISELMKAETELNSIFIDMYGLGHILSPRVCRDDITLPDTDAKAVIKDLVSYCVGLYFGRFSESGGINPDFAISFAPADDIAIYIEEYVNKTFGNSSAEYICNILGTDICTYLKNNFIKDHTKKYKNHPIYHKDRGMIKYHLGDDTLCQNIQR